MSQLITASAGRRRPQVDTTPLVRLQTVQQTESIHPALRGRLRNWIHKSDAGHPDYMGLRRAVVRVGRSLFLNAFALDEWLAQRAAMPPTAPRAVVRPKGASATTSKDAP